MTARTTGAKRGNLVTVVSQQGDAAPRYMPLLVQTVPASDL